MKTEITQRQLEAIRFYMGDPEIVKNGPYRGGSKAYNTINALLHYGVEDEKEKIRDRKPIELYDSGHLKCYLELIFDIREAMEAYRDRHHNDDNLNLISYRIDRLSAVERFHKDRKIYGYFSTCKWGFLPEYAHTKSDIVMLEVERDRDVPYLDFSELFRECYAKPEEAEILLPYGTVIAELREIPLTKEECHTYCDMNGKPPHGKWRIRVSCGDAADIWESRRDAYYRVITDEQTVGKVGRCMRILSENGELSGEDERFYSRWKMLLLRYLG